MSAVLDAPPTPPPAAAAPIPEAPPPAAPEEPTAPPPAEIPLPTPWSAEILTPDGKFIEGWQDKLPDDFADDRALLGRFGDLKTLVKAFKDNMAGARAKTEGLVKVPGQDATPEDRAAYLKAIGVPDDPKGYDIKQPEKLPDGVSWDQGLSEKFAGVAHEIGLTPAQVAKLQEWQVGSIAEQVQTTREASAQALEQERAELNRTFGASLPKAIDHAQRLAKQEGLRPEIFDPNHADFWGVDALAFASRVAGKLGEDRLIPGAAVKNLGGAALGRDIATNAQNPYYERFQKGDPEIQAMVRDLYAQG